MPRERNEALDCRVYARAAAWIAGIDRWTERKWQELEKQLGIVSPPRAIVAGAGNASLDQSLPAAPASEKRSVSAARPSAWLGGRSRRWLRRR
jgi:phage terminase large subunit GpA-like protein